MISTNQLMLLKSKGIDASSCSRGQAAVIIDVLEKNGNDVKSPEVQEAVAKYGASLIG